MMPDYFKRELQSYCVNFSIEINRLCNKLDKQAQQEPIWTGNISRYLLRNIAAKTHSSLTIRKRSKASSGLVVIRTSVTLALEGPCLHHLINCCNCSPFPLARTSTSPSFVFFIQPVMPIFSAISLAV